MDIRHIKKIYIKLILYTLLLIISGCGGGGGGGSGGIGGDNGEVSGNSVTFQ